MRRSGLSGKLNGNGNENDGNVVVVDEVIRQGEEE